MQAQPPCVLFPLSQMFSIIALLMSLVPRVPSYHHALHLAMIAVCTVGMSVLRMAANARNWPTKVMPPHRHPAPP